MEAYFWYQHGEIATIQSHLERALRDCGFAVLEHGTSGWNRVRLGRKAVWWSVTNRIEAHQYAQLAVASAASTDLPAVLPFFLGRIRDHHFPVREASLHLGIPPEIPWFTLEKFRNEKPPLLMMESEDGSWTAAAPGNQDYWGSFDETEIKVRYALGVGRNDLKPPRSTCLFCRQV